ncbi:MAG: DUF3380 domain-containing protein [Anaerolineales bacterium]|nr:DUF3380 domain-containing protein [Anaerolineales bacterium]
MATLTAVTTARVNLRAGAGTQHSILATLPVKTALEVLENPPGDWLKVQAAGRIGYVHRGFIQLSNQGVSDGFLRDKAAPTPAPAVSQPPAVPQPPAVSQPPLPADSLGAGLEQVPLEPPAAHKLRVNPKDPLLNRLAASIWNRFGGLLTALSAELQVEPAAAVAVFAVESGGNCFDPVTKKVVIRFENQIFFDQWGKRHPDLFAQHFTFNPAQRWLDHKWRPTPGEPWRPAELPNFHGNQGREWEVFSFAQTLDDTAAKMSISLGAPQIMGFNYASCGYESVQEMFAAFAAGERSQVIAFFDFVQGPSTNSRSVLALQTQDFNAFAARYNGPGQAAKYGSLIRTTYDAFQQMRAAAGF